MDFLVVAMFSLALGSFLELQKDNLLLTSI